MGVTFPLFQWELNPETKANVGDAPHTWVRAMFGSDLVCTRIHQLWAHSVFTLPMDNFAGRVISVKNCDPTPLTWSHLPPRQFLLCSRVHQTLLHNLVYQPNAQSTLCVKHVSQLTGAFSHAMAHGSDRILHEPDKEQQPGLSVCVCLRRATRKLR